MRTISVELLSDAINNIILRTPGRNFPGMVIQGDSLRQLHKLAGQTFDLAKRTSSEELEDAAGMLFDELDERIRFYEQVLDSHNHELPYPIRISEKPTSQ